MAKIASSKSVPKGMQATYEAITTLTDAFCRDHLNDEYRELAQRMTAALCRKRPSPVVSGQPRTWACGIIYVLGQINFLSDRSTQPYMAMADVCALFGVSQGFGAQFGWWAESGRWTRFQAMRCDTGIPSRVIRFSTAQPTRASVFWAGRARARRPRPMRAL